MSKPKYSQATATAEAKVATQEIAELLQGRNFAAAQQRLEALGKSQNQIKRRRVRKPPEDLTLQRPVFICGLHRSGTTLLHDYLCTYYDVSFFKNAKVPENEGQFLQDLYMAERPFGGPGSFAFYPQMQFAPVRRPERAQKMAARLLGQWQHWVTGNSPVLLEKSPPNIVRIPFFRSLYPKARFVVWTRDPRAVSLSTRKWHKLPVSQLMMHWNTAYMQAFNGLDDDCLVCSYEAFCADPAGTAAEIARFCDLEPRSTPLDIADRFGAIRNSNETYLSQFPKGYRLRNQVRAWEYFGYSFNA